MAVIFWCRVGLAVTGVIGAGWFWEITMKLAASIVATSFICVLGMSSPVLAGVTGNTYTVYIFNFDFSQNHPDTGSDLPNDPTINIGDTVNWVLVNGFHDVTSMSGMTESFASTTTDAPGLVLSHTFTQLGDFEYYCSRHGFEHDGHVGGMSGVIHVVPTPASGLLLATGGLLASRRRR